MDPEQDQVHLSQDTHVRSMVQVPTKAKAFADSDPRFEVLREKIKRDYAKNFFSGKPTKDPPILGAYGKAKIRLRHPHKVFRHRELPLKGDRLEAMKAKLKEFMERGWLETCTSEWASPASVVPKKVAGEWRLVVDYRGLNEQTEFDSYTLPPIEDMLQRQHERRLFTVINLKHGYHQMPLAPESCACTAMSTPLGPLQWKVMPMGCENGNASFQRMLEDILKPVADCANPLVDDIIVGSGTESMTDEEVLAAHEAHLRIVLDLLVHLQLTRSADKATIAVNEVEFAGHVVDMGQRKPSPGKIAAVENWERPKTVSEMRAFLGFCNYYPGYVRMYAEMAVPITALLKGNRDENKKGSKKPIIWDDEANNAFEAMKRALLDKLKLWIINPNKGFVLRTDASDYAVGAVLEQVGDDGTHVPVVFWSRPLAPGQRRTWTPREKETYAIICALRKWAGHIVVGGGMGSWAGRPMWRGGPPGLWAAG